MAVQVRVIDASLGKEAQMRLVVSGVADPDRLRTTWASSGATVERVGARLHATSTLVSLTRAAGRSLPGDEAALLEGAAQRAVASWLGPAPALTLPSTTIDIDAWPAVMGIVNVTPDSFSDGGVLYPRGHPEAAVEAASRMVAEGAAVIDVGGESTRPGAEPVGTEEELRRVLPVVEQLAGTGTLVSIDTSAPAVAQAAIEAGAQIVNDVSGGRNDELLETVAANEVAYVLMHTRGTPADMASHAEYDDVLAEVYEFLADGLARCEDMGIARERIVIDPGLGFAKTPAHNVALLRGIRQFTGLGRPVLIGASRKSFLGQLLGGADAQDRLEASLACAAMAAASGVALVRAHDVMPTARVLGVVRAVLGQQAGWPEAPDVAAVIQAGRAPRLGR